MSHLVDRDDIFKGNKPLNIDKLFDSNENNADDNEEEKDGYNY